MSVTGVLSERLLTFLFPRPCLACNRDTEGSRAFLGLCVRCSGRLRPLSGSRCPLCARALPGPAPPGYRCGACRRRPAPFDRLVALWSYDRPLDRVIRALKFEGLDYLGRHIGEALAERLRVAAPAAELAVAVPLHWRRQLARGYNQAERIAAPLASGLGLPLVPALRRVRATPPQARLPRRERARNLGRAFRARRGPLLAGRSLLLVDDVITTGATLRAAAAALRRAGAAEITVATAARTPSPEEATDGICPTSNAV